MLFCNSIYRNAYATGSATGGVSFSESGDFVGGEDSSGSFSLEASGTYAVSEDLDAYSSCTQSASAGQIGYSISLASDPAA